MILEFWNTVWIYFLSKCLLGFRIDTSRMPFSTVVRLIPFYKLDFWYNADYEYDVAHNVMNYKIDLIIPFICDIMLIWQV